MTNTDRAWSEWGRRTPYYGVLSKEEFSGPELDDTVKASFFQSGEAFVDGALEIVADRLGSDVRPRRALDFGCGVGRLSIPLARRCDDVVGTDVSAGMLAEATDVARRAGMENVEFVESDDALSQLVGAFDLILSFIVFQHIPPSRGEIIFERLVQRLTEDGIGVVHFTYGAAASTPRWRRLLTTAYERVPGLFGLRSVLKGQQFSQPQMHMNHYDLSRLFGILQANSCHDVHVRFTEASHYNHPVYGAIIFFSKRKLDTSTHS